MGRLAGRQRPTDAPNLICISRRLSNQSDEFNYIIYLINSLSINAINFGTNKNNR